MKFLAINVLNFQGRCKCRCSCLDATSKSTLQISHEIIFCPHEEVEMVPWNKNTTNDHPVLFIMNNILTGWHFSALGFRCVSSPNPPMAPTQQVLRWPAWRFRWWRWTKMATLTWHTSRLWWEPFCIPLGFRLQQHVTTKVITGQQTLANVGRGASRHWTCRSSDPANERCCSLPGGQTQG